MTKESNYVKVVPESVDIGDTIEVVSPTKLGVTTRVKGVVGHRESNSAGLRGLYTAAGGVLLTWRPGMKNATVFRISRSTPKPEELDLGEF